MLLLQQLLPSTGDRGLRTCVSGPFQQGAQAEGGGHLILTMDFGIFIREFVIYHGKPGSLMISYTENTQYFSVGSIIYQLAAIFPSSNSATHIIMAISSGDQAYVQKKLFAILIKE